MLITRTPREVTLSCHRKRDLKHGAGVPVAGADGSLVQVDDLPGQRKADAGFSAFPHVEAVKDVGKIFLGEAGNDQNALHPAEFLLS